jgi:hypothetical protein
MFDLYEYLMEGTHQETRSSHTTPDLGEWNVQLYYEAMGYDFEDVEDDTSTKENDPQ